MDPMLPKVIKKINWTMMRHGETFYSSHKVVTLVKNGRKDTTCMCSVALNPLLRLLSETHQRWVTMNIYVYLICYCYPVYHCMLSLVYMLMGRMAYCINKLLNF